MINRSIAHSDCGEITTDNISGIQMGVSHLLNTHRHTIAHICGPSHSWNGRERLDGYKQALSAAGLPIEESLMLAYPPEVNETSHQTLRTTSWELSILVKSKPASCFRPARTWMQLSVSTTCSRSSHRACQTLE